ncbi:MAG TPA: hypothetical protein EYP14_07610, partial [Planctomycetaceae bacterium]|nr:hypothetical protein [Planctomycetaceae bacterium]
MTVDNTSFSANRTTGNGAGVFVASNGTIDFTDAVLSGNIAEGSGGAIDNTGTVTLADSRVVDNQAGQDGGGIRTSRSVTLTDTTVSGNQAGQDGGGIHSGGAGTTTITLSTISGNTAGRDGGGVFNTDAAVATVDQTTIRDNTAGTGGGGVVHRSTGSFTVTASTISGNTAGQNGGGLLNGGAMTLLNSTVSGNRVTPSDDPNSPPSAGGGLFNEDGTLTVMLSTITANVADIGGGIRNKSSSMPVNLGNTIVAGNTARDSDPDLSAADQTQLVSLGHNLIGDNTGADIAFPEGDPNANADIVGTDADPKDPLLGPLSDNGGPTWTHALLFGSPARDAGNNVGVPAADQRGFGRIFDGDGDGLAIVDIGAFESGFVVNSFADAADVNPGDNVSADADGRSTLRAAIMEANARPGDDSILLGPGTYTLTLAGPGEDAGATGDLDITDLTGNLTIIGAGPETTVIQINGTDRVFHVLSGAELILRGVTIRGGTAVRGGGLLNEGGLTLENVVVDQNAADFG